MSFAKTGSRWPYQTYTHNVVIQNFQLLLEYRFILFHKARFNGRNRAQLMKDYSGPWWCIAFRACCHRISSFWFPLITNTSRMQICKMQLFIPPGVLSQMWQSEAAHARCTPPWRTACWLIGPEVLASVLEHNRGTRCRAETHGVEGLLRWAVLKRWPHAGQPGSGRLWAHRDRSPLTTHSTKTSPAGAINPEQRESREQVWRQRHRPRLSLLPAWQRHQAQPSLPMGWWLTGFPFSSRSARWPSGRAFCQHAERPAIKTSTKNGDVRLHEATQCAKQTDRQTQRCCLFHWPSPSSCWSEESDRWPLDDTVV